VKTNLAVTKFATTNFGITIFVVTNFATTNFVMIKLKSTAYLQFIMLYMVGTEIDKVEDNDKGLNFFSLQLHRHTPLAID